MSENAVPDTAPAKPKLSWGEKRDRRRRRRKLFEEVLGWIIVPALIYLGYLAYQAVGGLPPEWISALRDVIAALMGRGG